MHKFAFAIALVAISACSVAQAGRIYFTGDVGVQSKTSGVINVLVDLEPGQNMQNGGITLTINNDNATAAGAIAFEDTTVNNEGNKWTIASDTTTAANIQINTASVLSPALPTGGQAVPFATINWTKVGNGRSNISFDLVPETFVDGIAGDVTSQYTGENNFVSFVPEPTSLAMAGLGLIGLVLRRRNG